MTSPVVYVSAPHVGQFSVVSIFIAYRIGTVTATASAKRFL